MLLLVRLNQIHKNLQKTNLFHVESVRLALHDPDCMFARVSANKASTRKFSSPAPSTLEVVVENDEAGCGSHRGITKCMKLLTAGLQYTFG